MTKHIEKMVRYIPMEIAYLSSFHDLSFSISDTVYLLCLELKYIGDKHAL